MWGVTVCFDGYFRDDILAIPQNVDFTALRTLEYKEDWCVGPVVGEEAGAMGHCSLQVSVVSVFHLSLAEGVGTVAMDHCNP